MILLLESLVFIFDEIFNGLILGIFYGGISSLIIMFISIAFRYFTDEQFSPIYGIIVGLGIVGISGGLLAILDQPTIAGGVQIMIASLIIAVGVKFGDKMALKMPKFGFSFSKMFTRNKKRGTIVVKMPNENLIRNIAGKPRVMDRVRKELSGKEFSFPNDLTMEELVRRVRRQLITDWGLGDVEIELNEEGEVTYLAAADREQSISEDIEIGYVALPLEYEVSPYGIAQRDIVRIRLDDGSHIPWAEVKGVDRDNKTITILTRESLLEKYQGKKAKQIIALPSFKPIPLIKDIMTAPVKTITQEENVYTAVQLMNKYKIGSLAVTENKKTLGIVTDRDILGKVIEKGLDPNSIKIADIMSAPPIFVDSNKSVEEASKLMKKEKIKKLLVLNNGELVGIVTTDDFLRIGKSIF